MPAISTLPWAMVMVHAGTRLAPLGRPPVDTYFIGPEDCTVLIQHLTSDGLTVFLPGPSPGTRRPPDDGDWYIIADSLGRLGQEGGGLVHVDPQGYTINGSGLPLQMPDVPHAWAAFQFDAANRDWIVVIGGIA
jgi:hypothetical protein